MTDISLATNVPFALTAGVATFFSPCAYPLLPGYVGFYVNSVEADSASVLGAGVRGVAAAVGVLATFALLAGATVRVGYSTLSNITVFETLVGALLIAFGLLVVSGRMPSVSVPLPKRRTGVFGFGLFGAGYALAGAGCVAPVFLGVIARAIALPAETAVLVLSVYAGTVAVLMAATTVATGVGLVSNANRVMAHAGLLKRVAGAVMIAAGVGQLYLSLVVY
ncbi:cytochrome c biogenesis CcdA family protein [Halorubrum kocurii]|uniref:Cytochrome C biogenesis protein transmembrane region n=1 Tax=Halorubrum kocurii JCM 14978 TaxID=1230456 RepID=M0P4C2_9EURY|nr:cytochrome c biogenesis protein CcdA [Halorubrum kocurii]EMA64399.1 cytochrome C biogenesis protein transmembrane region [Halorubrum kocurii JCM 14978]